MSSLPSTSAVSRRAQAIPTRSTQKSTRDLPKLTDWVAPKEVLNLKHADTIAFPPPEWALPRFTEAASGDFEPYTPFRGDAGVLDEVAVNVSEYLAVPIDPRTELVVTAGTQGGLFSAMAVLAEDGAQVALLDPDYMSTARTLRFLGAEPSFIPWARTGSGGEVDLAALERALGDGAKLFMFSNPNNPTGTVLGEGQLESIASLIVKYDAYVVADELYSRLTYGSDPFVHLIALPGMRERCVTALGPSKAESMTGYRLGCMVVPRALSNAFEDVVGITFMRAPSYSQPLLRGWLRDDRELMERRRDAYHQLRDLTVDSLKDIPGAEVSRPQGGSYIFVTLPDLGYTDDEVATFLRRYASVDVNPGYQFGPSGRGSFRMCFAQDVTEWESRIQVIREALSQLIAAGSR